MDAQRHYFRYTPRSGLGGFSPIVGDVVPGRIYEVRSEYLSRFADAQDWEKATKRQFDAQD